MKKYITMGMIVFSTIGSWIGAAFDHGNWFGLTSIIMGIIGTGVGIWVGYLISDWITNV